MNVAMGGSRGSMAVCGADQAMYGGDTFSFLAEARDGTQVLIDAGSGARHLLGRLRPGATLFFTHTHLDHLLGLPFLAGAWPRELALPRGGLPEVLERVFSPPVWPVRLPPAVISAPVSPVDLGGLRVSWRPVPHPDGCVAYRIDEPATGASAVVATDVEWPTMSETAKEKFVRFAANADLMVFDAQYLPEEYEAHRGWGHSTWQDAVEVAAAVQVGTLWLMHHSPERTDAEIDAIAAEAAKAFPGAVIPQPGRMQATL
jgi:ribonuclease BN (tRNA processing enzyme)